MLRDRYRCRVETLPAVDRGVAGLVRTLRETGELGDTIIVYASDNGTFDGQHRLPGGKGLAYEEAAHLPFAMRVPAKFRGGAQAPAIVDDLVSNIDYAPTLVDWAGTETCPEVGDCRVMDGRSLLPLVTGRDQEWPPDRALGTELDLQKEEVQPGRGISCAFQGARQGTLAVHPAHLAARPQHRHLRARGHDRALRPCPRPVRAAQSVPARRRARPTPPPSSGWRS